MSDPAEWLIERANSRHVQLTDRLAAISGARGMPNAAAIAIGSARETRGVALFADLVDSTSLATRYRSNPALMLATLNILIPTLQDCVSLYGGEFEKNTGDGILAHFGVGSGSSDAEAVEAATLSGHAMLWAVGNIINPELRSRRLMPVRITIGADLGDLLIARIGLSRGDNPLVAVGLAANRAAKIQDRCQPGQFRVGEDFFMALVRELRRVFQNVVFVGANWPFQVEKSEASYQAEEANARAKADIENARRRAEAHRKTLDRPFLALVLPYMPPPLALPDPVSRTRSYRVYRYTGFP